MIQVYAEDGDALTYEALTPGDTSTGVTAANLNRPVGGAAQGVAKTMLVVCEDNALNIAFDGSTPTAKAGTNVGILLATGDSIRISGYANIARFKCIDRVSGSAGIAKCIIYYA